MFATVRIVPRGSRVTFFKKLLRDLGILPNNSDITFSMPAELISELNPGDGLLQCCGVFFFTLNSDDDTLHYEQGAHPELERILRLVGPAPKDRTLRFVSEWTDAGPGSIEATDAADRFLECGAGKIGFYANLNDQ